MGESSKTEQLINQKLSQIVKKTTEWNTRIVGKKIIVKKESNQT